MMSFLDSCQRTQHPMAGGLTPGCWNWRQPDTPSSSPRPWVTRSTHASLSTSRASHPNANIMPGSGLVTLINPDEMFVGAPRKMCFSDPAVRQTRISPKGCTGAVLWPSTSKEHLNSVLRVQTLIYARHAFPPRHYFDKWR